MEKPTKPISPTDYNWSSGQGTKSSDLKSKASENQTAQAGWEGSQNWNEELLVQWWGPWFFPFSPWLEPEGRRPWTVQLVSMATS